MSGHAGSPDATGPGDFSCGNSMHPLDDVTRGEALIKQVYETIRNSPHWEHSLLIVTFDEHGGWLNVNGDTAAAGVAAEMKAAKLVLLTDTPGILTDRKNPDSLIPSLTSAEAELRHLHDDADVLTGLETGQRAAVCRLQEERRDHVAFPPLVADDEIAPASPSP